MSNYDKLEIKSKTKDSIVHFLCFTLNQQFPKLFPMQSSIKGSQNQIKFISRKYEVILFYIKHTIKQNDVLNVMNIF